MSHVPTTAPESARTANARSRMATARNLRSTYGFSMNPALDAANAALVAAHEARVIAREAWDHATAATDNGLDVSGTARTARDNANRTVAAADLVAGVVSSVACGLYGVTYDGRVFSVESTDHGHADLRGVRYLYPTTTRHEVEGPEVVEIVRFFDNTTDSIDLARRIAAGLI